MSMDCTEDDDDNNHLISEAMQPCEAPEPLKLEGLNVQNSLSSSAIKTENLRSIEDTISLPNFPTVTTSNAGKIAIIFARESLFGTEVMAKCTPLGAGRLNGLPVAELYRLKQLMLQHFPQYWHNARSFEAVWKKCQIALEYCCSSLRRKIPRDGLQ